MTKKLHFFVSSLCFGFGYLICLPFCLFLGSLGALLFGGFAGFGAGFELVDAAFDVEDALFTGEEGVGGGGNVDLDQRVFIAIVPLGLVFGGDSGARQKAKTIVQIFENDEPIIVRM